MKRHFWVIFLSVILAIVLVSCKNSDTSSTSNTTAPISSNNSTNEKNSDTDKKPGVTPSNANSNSNSSTSTTSIKNTKCRLYFFNTSELKHYYVDKMLPIENGALVSALTKELQSTSYNKNFLPLTDKVKIKSAKLDKTTGILNIVFSDDYVHYMTLGTATESGLLTSLLCTYGYNLGVNKISIYFKDKLYTCLGDLQEGYFTVKYPAAKPYTP